ncbi:MAG: hypothetical protein ACRD8W_14285 [Nitrososphaeraceae archaeon]
MQKDREEIVSNGIHLRYLKIRNAHLGWRLSSQIKQTGSPRQNREGATSRCQRWQR